VCSISGKKLFTPETHPVVEEQYKKCKYLEDVLPVSEMYLETKPTDRMRHNLTHKRSCRGESHVESSQGQQQHYGNNGMGAKTADDHILRGHARANVRIRAKLAWNEGENRKDIPAWMRGVPFFYDHLRLGMINEVTSATVGASMGWTPFDEVHKIPADNGERFLSEYFEAEKVRKQQFPPDRLSDRCTCNDCMRNLDPLPWEKKNGVEVPLAAMEMRGSENNDEDGGLGWNMFDDDDVALLDVQPREALLENAVPPVPLPPMQVVQAPPRVPQPQLRPWQLTPLQQRMPPVSRAMQMPRMPAPQMLPLFNPMLAPPMIQMQQQLGDLQRQMYYMTGSPPAYSTRGKKPNIAYCCHPYRQDRENKKNGRPRHHKKCPNRYM